jgi:hypothetical protein
MIWCLIQYKVKFALLDIELFVLILHHPVPYALYSALWLSALSTRPKLGLKNKIWIVVQDVVFWQPL